MLLLENRTWASFSTRLDSAELSCSCGIFDGTDQGGAVRWRTVFFAIALFACISIANATRNFVKVSSVGKANARAKRLQLWCCPRAQSCGFFNFNRFRLTFVQKLQLFIQVFVGRGEPDGDSALHSEWVKSIVLESGKELLQWIACVTARMCVCCYDFREIAWKCVFGKL